jgi:hypothetical protein
VTLSGVVGTVARDGSASSGSGFTSERVGESDGYSYRVVYDGSPFEVPPSVLVTPSGGGVFASVQSAVDSFTVIFERVSFAARTEITTVQVPSGFSFAALRSWS